MTGKKLKILVVDDEDSLRISLASILELEGFDVKMAASGLEAVDIAKKEKFDILFSDIRMPEMNGTEAFKIIKKLQPDIIGVMMTAYALNDLIVDALNCGAFTCLSKPFEIDTILATIKDITSRPFAVVIDNQENVNMKFLKSLQNCGLNVACSPSDLDKVKYMFEHKPDILIIDIDKEIENTILIMKKLKELFGKLPKTILIGNEEKKDVIEQISKLGLVSFIKKPIIVSQVFEVLGKGNRKFNVTIVNANGEEFDELKEALKKNDFNLLVYNSSQDFFDDIKNSFFDAILINTEIENDVADFHEKLQSNMHNIGAIYILPDEINNKVVKQKGCFYLHKPFEMEEVINLMNKLREQNV